MVLTQRDRDLILSAFGLPEVADRIIQLLNAAGTGDISGPGVSVDNSLPRFDGITGILLQGSNVLVDDSDNVTGVTSLALSTYEQFTEQVAGPSNPPAGRQRFYFKTDGNAYKKNSAGVESAIGGGVSGPGSSTDNAITRFDGITGQILQNSSVTIADTTGAITFTAVTGGNILWSFDGTGRIGTLAANDRPLAVLATGYVNAGTSPRNFDDAGGDGYYDGFIQAGSTPGYPTTVAFSGSNAYQGGAIGFEDSTDSTTHFNMGLGQAGNSLRMDGGYPDSRMLHNLPLDVSFTFPDTAVDIVGASDVVNTTAGTNPTIVIGFQMSQNGGYVGTGSTFGIYEVNNLEATAPIDLWNPSGNFGIMGADWAPTQEKVGTYGYSYAGSRGVGIAGTSLGQDTSGTAIGVFGGAQVPATGLGVGGYFKIGTTAGSPTDIPVLPFSPVSGALVADNGDTTNDIAVFQDDAVTKIRIKDKGLFTQAVTLATAEVAHTTTATPPASGTSIKAVEGIIAPGYTDAFGIRAGNFVNLSPSTGYNLGNVYGSYGVRGAALSDNTSKNIAVDGEAASGNVNIGVVGHVLVGDPGVSTNVGVMGLARRDGLNNVAIYGKMGSTIGALQSALPTGEAVLLLDNGNSNVQLALFQVAGSSVGSINELGELILGPEVAGAKSLSIDAGTLSPSKTTAVAISATLPNTGGYYHLMNLNMDTTGVSAAAEIAGILLNIGAGYTGTAATFGIAAENDAAGVGATVLDSFYNAGASFASGAAATEHIGVAGEAFQGTKLWGTTGFAYAGTISNTGVYGAARETGSTAAGGYFKISNTQSHLGSQLTPPTGGAIVVDNDDTNTPIAVFRNGTAGTVAGVDLVGKVFSTEKVYVGADITAAKNFSVTGGTLSPSSPNWNKQTGTFPDDTGTYRGVDYVFNSTAGSNPGQLHGMRILMNSNSTPLTSFALSADNSIAGTQGVGLSSPTGNYGFSISCGAPATEHVAIYGQGYAGSKVWGTIGTATGSDAGGTAIGMYGGAQQSAAGAAVGGYFKIHTSSGQVLDPNSPQNGGIVVDNGNTTFNIATFMANASIVAAVDPIGAIFTSQKFYVGTDIPTGKSLSITGGSLTTGSPKLMAFTASVPNSSGEYFGFHNELATTGTSPSTIQGIHMNLTAGYTGSGNTVGVFSDNNTAGSSTLVLDSNYNAGGYFLAGAASTQHAGLIGEGYEGTKTWGTIGYAYGASANATGVYGGAVKSSNTAVGGYFKISTTQSTIGANLTPPVAGAIVVDNDNTGNNIASFQRGATTASSVDPDGNFVTNTAGVGFKIKEGSNARMGTATLVGGTVTVSNTSVTANTRIFYSVSTAGGVQGFLSSTQSAGASFTINSTSVADTSDLVWELIEPA